MGSTVNKRIQEVKEFLELTDIEFCNAAGFSTGTLHRIRRNEQPTRKTTNAIIAAFSVPQEWLMEGKGQLTATLPEDPEPKSSWKDEAFEALKSKASHLESEVKFLRELVLNMSKGQLSENFNIASVLAGVSDKNIDRSVRVAA